MCKFKVGDDVIINKARTCAGYENLLGRTAIVQNIKSYEHPTGENYIKIYVSVVGRVNMHQENGWFVYEEEDLLALQQCDDQADSYEYCMAGTRYSMDDFKIIKEKMEEFNMNYNDLVNIYYERKRKQIDKKYNEKIAKIKSKDEIFKEINTIQTKYKDVAGVRAYIDFEYKFSDQIREELLKLDKVHDEDCDNLYEEQSELKAHCSMCENYEQVINILKTYGVVNENGTLNI